MEVARNQIELRDDPGFISPPWLEPAWQCGTAVVVHGFIPRATLDLEVGGAVVVPGFPGGFPSPNGARVPLPAPLAPGVQQQIRARQTFGGVTSDWSAPVPASDHRIAFPAGPPRPQTNPAPVYRCGVRTGVANLLAGCEVWITAAGTEVGRVSGASTHQGVDVAPSYGPNQSVEARASLCGDLSPPSPALVTQEPPVPLPTPALEPAYHGGAQLSITGIVNGAVLTVTRTPVPKLGASPLSFASWGGRHVLAMDPPFEQFEALSVVQQLCPGAAASASAAIRVKPCSALPAAGVEPIQAGDGAVVLNSFVPDARIQVFVNHIKAGDGSGPRVQLREPVVGGSIVHVLQSVGTCVGLVLQQVFVQCVAPAVGADPSVLDLFPVGTAAYDGGTTVLSTGFNHKVAGTIHYPAEADGAGKPFNRRCRRLGRVPLAVLVHGRHGSQDSHLGYVYLQRQLAGMGIVAMSVDCNASDGSPAAEGQNINDGRRNILERAELIRESIKHLQALDGSGHPLFGGCLDFQRLALMGHSRGGEAVVLFTELPPLAGIGVKGVLSLAPVFFGASSGQPIGYPYMTIVPACDGDVVDNEGLRYYDSAGPAHFKAQLYVLHANHNFFNSRWLNDDAGGGLPLMARVDHERILSAYGCAFFRAVLLGHDMQAYLDGHLRPPGIISDNVQMSFKRPGQLTVDDHEDGNGIGSNSLGAATAQEGGLIAFELRLAQPSAGGPPGSFYGDTMGMVTAGRGSDGQFVSRLREPLDLGRQQVWIRAAEVYGGAAVPAEAAGFMLGLEDARGVVAWVDCDGVGGLPRPLDRKAFDLPRYYAADKTKTVLKTLRFPAACFAAPRFDITSVTAIRLRLNRGLSRALAFDDLQIVGP